MISRMIERLTSDLGYAVVDEGSVDPFAQEHEHCVLFFTEDPSAFPETNDVAVILPELVNAFADRLVPAVVARSAERVLKTRYGFSSWPALVFLRRGQYLGAIARVQDWEFYLGEIERILASEPTAAPTLGIPVETPANRGNG